MIGLFNVRWGEGLETWKLGAQGAQASHVCVKCPFSVGNCLKLVPFVFIMGNFCNIV